MPKARCKACSKVRICNERKGMLLETMADEVTKSHTSGKDHEYNLE